MISQRQRNCSASSGSTPGHDSINENTDFSFPKLDSARVNCLEASSSGDELSPASTVSMLHSGRFVHPAAGLQRGYTSDAAAGSGRGRGRDASPSFPQRRASSLGRGAGGDAVNVGQAADGQFDDPESEKKAKPVEGKSTILQQILAASAKENEEAAKRAENRSGGAEPSGRNGAGGECGMFACL